MGTFCSGIGAPEVAARGMFDPIWFSEIEPFPCAVFAHHWPTVPNLGDMTASDLVERIAGIGLPDVVVAGLPCQPFSVAGLRKGEADPRNLTARFVEIADAIDDLRRDAGQPPVWWLVENVPGLLSDKGNAFGALLGGMVGSNSAIVPSGRWECAGVAAGPRRSAAWRVLDAQFFGVAQRRRRVFALFVEDSGILRCADALLPIIDSMSWNPPPRRETGKDVAPTISARTKGGGGLGTDFDCDGGLIASTGNVAHCLNAGGMGRQDYETETVIAHTLKAEGFDASEDGTGRGTPIVPVAFDCKGTEVQYSTDGSSPTLRSMGHSNSHQNAGGHAGEAGKTHLIDRRGSASGKGGDGVCAVRRLTPRLCECARLQGFPPATQRITVEICEDARSQLNAIAETGCITSQTSAESASKRKSRPYALAAEGGSCTNQGGRVRHADLIVRIDLDRRRVQLLNAGKLIFSVNLAESAGEFRRLTLTDDFAHLAALMTQTAERLTRTGKAGSQTAGTSFITLQNGAPHLRLSGKEIRGAAKDVAITIKNGWKLSTSITSRLTPEHRAEEQTLIISSCSVLSAIASFIHPTTQTDYFSRLTIETITPHTAITYRGKPAADGPQYKAYGNSMAVPCVSWIMDRMRISMGAAE